MKNKEISKMFYEIADFLEIKDVRYKPRAYRRAARSIEALTEDIENIYDRGELEDIDGVGKSIAKKISEYLEAGGLKYYEDLKEDLPVDIEELTGVEGIGPKSVKKLYRELGVESLDDLETAAEKGEISQLEGFGEKMQDKILQNIEAAKAGRGRRLIGKIFPLVRNIREELRDSGVFVRMDVVGSYRRRNPTIGDVDILAVAKDPSEAMDVFCELSDTDRILAKGETKSSVVLSEGLQVDMRIVRESSYGSALMYFTGSKEHNVALRSRAKVKNWKLNEYGLFDSDGEKVSGETEEGVYGKLDMEFIPPELRENTGEIAAAEEGSLPELVEEGDVKGDLQVHTNYSDGAASLREMAEKAVDRGLDYFSVTDHGPSLKVAGGLSEDEFEEQAAEIEDVGGEVGIDILHGIEANIIGEGLDVPKDWCERFDILCAALHSRPKDPTERILSVLEEYPVDILVHPLNRRIFDRDPLDIDLDRVTAKAEEERVAIEINSQPERLDLDWQNVKKYRGELKYVISTDAHSTAEMDFMHLGVSQARKGWCESGDILNTSSLEEVRSYLNG